jgi:HSP20 family protein
MIMAETPEKTTQSESTTPEKGQEIQVKKSTGEVQRAEPAYALTPFEEMNQLFSRMDQLAESLFPKGWLRPFRREWPAWGEMMAPLESQLPRIDIIDREEEIVVRAELPGVDKKDLDVSLSDNSVTIKGSTRREEKEEKGNYYRSETSQGSFVRTLMLPGEVQGDKAKAIFKDGMLEVTLPKTETSKRRSIKVE